MEGKPATTIGLYTPNLQGFYFGELVNQIRQLCSIKGYRLIIIRTLDDGRIDYNLQTDQMHGVILLRNPISSELVEQLLSKRVPCVSAGYDYFPLNVPVVMSDSQFGVELAFTELSNRGKSRVAYIGDLRQYDLRKRYEYYSEALEQRGWPCRDDYLFNVSDALLTGGRAAASQFLQQQCDADAIIFGAGLTAVSFVHQLKQAAPARAEQLTYITFDAISPLPVFTPEVVSVDQNLNLVAYRCLNILESQLHQKSVASHTFVQPKLTRVGDNPPDDYDAFIATCVDLPAFHNANYAKSLLANCFEWPKAVVESNLDSIMTLSPFFERFMHRVFLSRYYTDNQQQCWVKHIKSFLPGQDHTIGLSDNESLCHAAAFPPKSILAHVPAEDDLLVHIPLRLQGKVWGYLSIFGHNQTATQASSFLAFTGFMENIAALYEQNLTIKQLMHKINQTQTQSQSEPQADTEATIEWHLGDNETLWSAKALAKLGFTSEIEQNIYRHMDITDRIHPQNLQQIRDQINRCRQNPVFFSVQVQFKMKGGGYSHATLSGSPTLDSAQKLSSIHFCLGIGATANLANP